jgi:ABC-type nitrate/sulfonate/bicarbonate transport system substrate-binding protein
MGAVNRLAVGLAIANLFALDAAAQPMTAVTQLGWLRNGEYAPIIIADAKGYFKEEGIDHKIIDGGPGKNPIPIVAVGRPSSALPPTQRS